MVHVHRGAGSLSTGGLTQVRARSLGWGLRPCTLAHSSDSQDILLQKQQGQSSDCTTADYVTQEREQMITGHSQSLQPLLVTTLASSETMKIPAEEGEQSGAHRLETHLKAVASPSTRI